MTDGSPTRRVLLASAGASLLSRAARAQPARRRRIATLSAGSAGSSPELWATFREELRRLGYGNENVAVESRWADGDGKRLPDLAAEIARLAPEVIVTTSSETALAVKQATITIPIVMAQSGDPVGTGLVASLARPGGNVTGLSSATQDLSAKLLELIKTVVPHGRRIAVLLYPQEPTTASRWETVQRAARDLQTEVLAVEAYSPGEIAGAFDRMTRERADALVVLTTTFFIQEKSRIAELAAGHRLPAIYDFPAFVRAGGLMSYGADNLDLFRRAAIYVDKILKGAKPADLPIEQPTKFTLAINLKTATGMSLIIPQSLLQRADEVIE